MPAAHRSPDPAAANPPEGAEARPGAPGLGRRFAEALAHRDFDTVMTVLDASVDFRALTPGRTWEAGYSRTVVDAILSRWFEDTDRVEEILSIETGSVGDRQRVAYRFRGTNSEGPFVVEQQAYYSESGGRIGWMRVLCSGFQPG